MQAPLDSPRLLRDGLLDGVSLLVAGAPRAGTGERSLAEVVAGTCAALGANVSSWQPAAEVHVADVLVLDGGGLFAYGLEQGRGLLACLELAWEVTRALVSEQLLPGGRAGRIIYLAPAPDAGEHAGAARAGLENLARTLSVEWARHAITVVTVAPGSDTGSSELAAVAAYLASPAGAYFSGCLLDLTGPRSAPDALRGAVS